MTSHWVCNKNNTTGAACREGTAELSGEPSSGFTGVRVALSLIFCVVFGI